MNDFNKIMDKAKELEAKMRESQENIKKIRAEGVSGSNSVKVILDGEGEMQLIEISDETLREEKSIIEDLILALNLYMQDIDNNESNLSEIQQRLFFLKNLERTYSLDLPHLIEKRNQLRKYFLKNDQDKEILDIENQIKILFVQNK